MTLLLPRSLAEWNELSVSEFPSGSSARSELIVCSACMCAATRTGCAITTDWSPPSASAERRVLSAEYWVPPLAHAGLIYSGLPRFYLRSSINLGLHTPAGAEPTPEALSCFCVFIILLTSCQTKHQACIQMNACPFRLLKHYARFNYLGRQTRQTEGQMC